MHLAWIPAFAGMTLVRRMGYRVYRVTNEDVARNLDGVLDSILHELEKPS